MNKPAYFDRVRDKAARRWDQLEADPDLAGPWHQLFKQVQSPRHVISELLQNADDAAATEASIRIEDKVFVFEHNGEDFKEEHFASLCRFGYSNKRALHTIGFRGIGFKSTFSLGDQVELDTPTLSVVFNKRRFSEPVWVGNRSLAKGRTRIRVPFADQKRKVDVEKNFKEWLKNPLSLLFFKSIRRMQMGDQLVQWERLKEGPVAQSEWMVLNGDKTEPYLHIRSPAEPFPEEALAEVRQERMLSEDEEAEFPPASVEIVLGVEGRLFVVLPTEVKTALPFACNAPFIQEPARVRIKDAATSATNEWLLKRTGRLAANSMLAWLARDDLPVDERAKAYGLLSDVNREDTSFEGVCAAIVEIEISGRLSNSELLLTNDGRLTKESQSVAIPEIVQDIWPGDQAAALLDHNGRPALARSVAAVDRAKLVHWRMVQEIGKDALLEVLSAKHLPRPKLWRQLRALWTYIAPEVTAAWTNFSAEILRIVPVQGKEALYAASEVVRLGEKKLLQSEDDWKFLAEFLVVLNPNWSRHLAEERLEAERNKDSGALKAVTAAYSVLEKIGLEETSDASVVVDRVASEFFARPKIPLSDCVRLAHIAATLGASAGSAFRYVTRDNTIRKADDGVMFDPTGDLEELLPVEQREERLLHVDYTAKFVSCKPEDWAKWIASGRSALLGFVPLISRRRRIYGQKAIREEAKRRGVKSEISFPYVTGDFIVEDWDFPEDAWHYWQAAASDDDQLWSSVTRAIFGQPDAYWSEATAAKILQVATTGNTRAVTWDSVLPSWVLRLREAPCLPDTRGFLHKPRDLLRRTVETDAYRDVEPFVHPSLDREAKAPLLDLLGVRDKPLGPHQMLERLRALAKAQRPPAQEVEKWYMRLDEVMDSCSTADTQAIKHAFRSEKLILNEGGDWSTTTGVYLSDDPAVPGAATVRSSVRHLTLWRKIEVEERPTAERAMQWLSELPSGQPLPADDARRVRALLPLHAATIWDECGHWINLAGEWSPVENLRYAMSMQSLVSWRNLLEPVKQQTADFQALPMEVSTAAPFSRLPLLSSKIDERFQGDLFLSGPAEQKPWLQAVGACLRRAELDDDFETARVRSLGEDLAKTMWQTAPGLQVVPYIDGTPAGTPRQADVLWIDRKIYVEPLSKAKLAKRVPEEIAKAFGRSDIRDALSYGFDRSAEDVSAYLEENFKLAPLGDAAIEEKPQTASTQSKDQSAENAETITSPQDELAEETVSTEETAPEQHTEPVQEDLDQSQETRPHRPRVQPKPPKPSIMERFAAAHGFKKDDDGRFFHSNGAWIGKTHEMCFPWERRTNSGELVTYYLDADHCLEHEPMQLAAEVWHLLNEAPGQYALILASADGAPLEISGAELKELEKEGRLKLYPASYRIAFESKEHA
jgi:hypothetical protein